MIAGHGKRMGEVLKKSSGWQQQGSGTDLYGWNGTGSGRAATAIPTASTGSNLLELTTTNNSDIMHRTLSSGSTTSVVSTGTSSAAAFVASLTDK